MDSLYLRRTKIKLGITDNTQDELLEILLEDAYFAIANYIGETVIPPQFNFIVEEIAIVRYRKIGSEGLKAEQIDVISNTFEDGNPLTPYLPLLNDYKGKTNKKLRML